MSAERRSPRRSKRVSTSMPTGTFIFPDGSKYSGEFSNHSQGRIERSGIGTHCFANGMEYFGAWVKDKMCGNGVLKYVSGAQYKGDFMNNEYHGTGTYFFPDGSSFTGTFTDSRLEGEGEFTDAEGNVWLGTVSGREALGLRLKYS